MSRRCWPRATANINCRLFPGDSRDAVLAQLTTIIDDPKVSVTIPEIRGPIATPAPLTRQIMEPIEKVAHELWPGIPVVSTLEPGASDAQFLNPAGIPTYGVTGIFTDPDGGRIHGLNERVRVQSVYEGRRRLRGSADPLPVFQIDEQGGSEQVARLNLAHPDGSVFQLDAPSPWPLDDSMRDGWFDGLPYFLQDLRPDGFLGRQFARAQRAMQDGNVGSSAAAGEFPKFTALRTLNGGPTHVLVKFSGSDNSAGTQRWSDLLVCEHLAAQTLATVPGLTAEQTSVLQAGNRTFLEAIRFDRHGSRGRSALCSWAAFNYGWFGIAGRPWTDGAVRFLERGLIDCDTAQAIKRLWHFGQLIGNNDMHDANLSFRSRVSAETTSLILAPAYDMLPMLYAPQRGVELPPVNFAPRLPLPAEREAWQAAATAADQFWSRAADDARISAEFRAICVDNLHTVRKTAGLLGSRGNAG